MIILRLAAANRRSLMEETRFFVDVRNLMDGVLFLGFIGSGWSWTKDSEFYFSSRSSRASRLPLESSMR